MLLVEPDSTHAQAVDQKSTSSEYGRRSIQTKLDGTVWNPEKQAGDEFYQLHHAKKWKDDIFEI